MTTYPHPGDIVLPAPPAAAPAAAPTMDPRDAVTLLRGDEAVGDDRTLYDLLDGETHLMLTMVEGERLTSRPVPLAHVTGTRLLFEVDGSMPWLRHAAGQAVNVCASDARNGRWVSVAGVARVLDDEATVAATWDPSTASAFDAHAGAGSFRAVLEIEAVGAEWWDAGGAWRRFTSFVKGMVADAEPVAGHGSFDLDGGPLAEVPAVRPPAAA